MCRLQRTDREVDGLARRRTATRLVVAGSVLLAGLAAAHDDRADTLRAAAVAIASTDPAHADFTDLEPLAALMGDARVVSLGEITHGDGNVFLARTRLVRFLHQRLGFDVLAFESGVIECERVMEALRGDAPIDEAIELGIYDVWAQSAEIRPLFEYVRETQSTDRPLRLVGFDPQFSSGRTAEYLARGFADVLAASSDEATGLEPMLRALADVANSVSGEAFETWNARLDGLERALARSTHAQADLWSQVVVSLRWQLRARRLAATAPPIDYRDPEASFRAAERIAAGNARDRGMADNLLWHLRQRWPGSRAIVWAANNHVRTASKRRSAGAEPVHERRMGQELKAELGDELYTVLTTCYEGTWAAASHRTADGTLRWRRGEHPRADAGTLADLLHETGLGTAWLDLEAATAACPWLAQPMTLRAGFDDHPPHRLSEYGEAILFVDVIEAATPANDASPE
jgi:erythromycin esterase-like protein